MSRWYSYLNSAKQILSLYKGDKPFALFIKDFFSQHKKYGSGDRKQISHLCYCYYRIGHAMKQLQTEERILSALFLCSTRRNEMLANLKPEWNEKTNSSFEEKLTLLPETFSVNDIFPWLPGLSDGIDGTAFSKSHLVQPDLFIRIRPGMKTHVLKKLQENSIAYSMLNDHCIVLPNNTNIDEILVQNKEIVVQDYSSQRTAELLTLTKTGNGNRPDTIKVWDCCAASGGKSLLAVDTLRNIDLTVSDVRKTIIHNLEQRFKQAGIKRYKSFTADLSRSPLTTHHSPFDLIIADVPCTGSGTWGRTPEQLFFFNEGKIDQYATLQKKIANNIIRYLQPGGYLLYITCSVFKKENEGIVGFILANSGFKVIEAKVLTGYNSKADTMFAALFEAPKHPFD